MDSDGSIITARSSIVSGSAHDPYIQISSFLTAVPTTASGNQSVSGTVGSSIIGQLPAGTAVLGSVATLQGTNPWNIAGSVLAVQGTWSGSVLAIQGTWSGSVLATISGTPNVNTAGSVVAFQGGTQVSSVVNSIPSSLLTGVHGHRNDTIASYLGGDLSWRPIATDSAGRIVTKPFSPEASRIEGYASTVNVSVTTLVAAAGAGLRNYITDLWFANTGAATTLVTFRSGGGNSVLGYTIAPTASGSNLPGLVMPIRTLANETFDFQASTGTSVLYATCKGFIAP